MGVLSFWADLAVIPRNPSFDPWRAPDLLNCAERLGEECILSPALRAGEGKDAAPGYIYSGQQ